MNTRKSISTATITLNTVSERRGRRRMEFVPFINADLLLIRTLSTESSKLELNDTPWKGQRRSNGLHKVAQRHRAHHMR